MTSRLNPSEGPPRCRQNPAHPWYRLAWLVLGGVSLSGPLSGCDRREAEVERAAGTPTEQPPRAKSPDRLPEGKLLEGEEEAFGFHFPRDMVVTRTLKTARAEGKVNFDDLTDYVKSRILARHAEMFGSRLVFPRVKIKGQREGIFRVTLIEGRRNQVLLIQDETKQPATVGLSEAERWKRAGLKPNGELVDPRGME